MRTTNLAALLAVGLLAAPDVAGAQDAVKPEIMLLVDTSQSMEWLEGADNPPACALPPANLPAARPGNLGRMVRSRIMTAKEVLAGTFLHEPWCTIDDRQSHMFGPGVRIRGTNMTAIPHYRTMCCVGGAPADPNAPCAQYRPCGNDHGKAPPAPNDATDLGIGTAFGDDGLIYQHRRDIKFGLMTFDTHPSPDAVIAGHFSFPTGGDNAVVAANVANAAGAVSVEAVASSDRINADAKGVANPNLGIRNIDAPFGPLIPSARGMLGLPRRLVAEDMGAVEAHNLYVMDQIRRLVPVGFTPIAPMLNDAVTYYSMVRDPANVEYDPAVDCRRRVAVLVTDGKPTDYYGGQACGAGGVCADGGRCVNRNGANICVYPEGFPYRTSEEYAAQLHDRGVPLFVIGFNIDAEGRDKARAIAAAGSPGLGPDNGPGFFLANDRIALRDALVRVTNAALAGTRTRTPPLVITPAAGDLVPGQNVKQYRLSAFTEVPGARDAFKYGRIERRTLGCPAQLDPQAQGALEDLGSVRFEEALAALAPDAERRVVSRKLDRSSNFVVAGGDQPMFDEDGDLGGGVAENLARLMTSANLNDPLAGPAPEDPLLRVGKLFNGFFGTRGLPDGVEGAVGDRQLGAIMDGQMVAIQPPALGIEDPAYVAYEQRLRQRPTLVAVGANDGMVHFFRARDGREVFNFVPRTAWAQMRDAATTGDDSIVDGPLHAGDVIECRNVVGGPRACRAGLEDLQFRSLLVGGTGRGGRNLFGIDITNLDQIVGVGNDDVPVRLNTLFDQASADRPYTWDVTHEDVPKLGMTVSRPLLTHVRVNGEIRATVIAGCGDDGDPAPVADVNAVGRCVLVLDAVTGHVIRRLETAGGNGATAMDRPMTGWPVAFPFGDLTPAERAYIGDKDGRLWRVDLRDPNPLNWQVAAIWPTADLAANLGYAAGRPIVGRPSVSLRDDGRVVVVFATGGSEVTGNDADRSHVVSLTDDAVIDAFGNVTFRPVANWVLPLRPSEIGTGSPIVADGVAYFTTVQPFQDVCASAQGRLYGVDYVRTFQNAEGAAATFELGGRQVNVKPMLPRYENGVRSQTGALSLLLPPGRVAYGAALITTPSCDGDDAARTEVVLNLADESRGATGRLNTNKMKIETVDQGQVQPRDIQGRMAPPGVNGQDLSICLDCALNGDAAPRTDTLGPFPSVVTSWGSTFID